MKIKVFFLILILFSSCSKDKSFVLAENSGEINDIIRVVIIDDKIEATKINNTVIIEDIYKKEIIDSRKYIKKDSLYIVPPYNMDILSLFHLWGPQSKPLGFDKKDLQYLLSQNSNPDSLKLPQTILKGFHHSTKKEYEQENANGNYQSYYTFTIPYLSQDKKTAYVESNYSCGNTCGNGMAFFLQKINGKWTVIEKWKTWMG
ncbi:MULTISPECIES: hypothetical protein [Chryseobacterium]|uniref:hypothetical protein n=1 Tax=Chryseobacterium TaxID=59732 RepID=UPI00105C775F|nr:MULTISPECIES: hypothetical protein [Chryseobacterium]